MTNFNRNQPMFPGNMTALSVTRKVLPLVFMLVLFCFSNVVRAQISTTAPSNVNCFSPYTYTAQDIGTWTVSGGTITSGQGTSQITVVWDGGLTSGSMTVDQRVSIPAGGFGQQMFSMSGITVQPPHPGIISGNQSICSGGDPVTLTSTSPASAGDGTYDYRWQKSANGTSWTNITLNGDQATYNPPTGLTVTTYYRRKVTSCSLSDETDYVTVTILPSLDAKTITAPSGHICYNSSTTVQGATPTGGDDSYEFIWETKPASGGSWQVTGGDTEDLITSNLTQNTMFRRTVKSCTYESLSGAAVTVYVHDNLDPATITANATNICYNTGTTLSANIATGGGGGYTYTWEKKPVSGGSWTAASGGTNTSLSTGYLTESYMFRRTVTTSSCGTAYTDITINVGDPLVQGTISGPSTDICYNTSTTLTANSATGGGGNYTYTWEKKPVSGSNWTSAGGSDNSVNTGNLTQDYIFQRTVTSDCETSIEQFTVGVLANLNPGVISGPGSHICYNSGTTLTATNATGGGGNYTYSWQKKPLNGGSWVTVSGTNSSVNTGDLTEDYIFQRTTVADCETDVTQFTVLVHANLDPATITANSNNICYNTATTLSANAATGGGGGYTYVWEKKPVNGGSWTTATGGTNTSLPTGYLTESYMFRRTVTTSSCGTAYTEITISVGAPLNQGVISGPSTDICYNTSATLTANTATGGGGNYIYSWKKKPANGGSWTTASGSNNSINTGNLTQDYIFQRTVTADCETSIEEFTVGVSDNLNPGAISGHAAEICYNSGVTLSATNATGGGGNYTYTWEKKPASGGSWTSAGGSANSVNTGNLTEDYLFRRTVQSDCQTLSVEVTIQVRSTLVAGSVQAPTEPVCYNTNTLLSATASTGGDTSQPYIYEWEKKPETGGSWSSAGTGLSLTTGNISAPTLFRRKTTSCGQQLYTTSVLVQVHPEIVEQTFDKPGITYCFDQQAIVKLQGSQQDVNYELIRNGTPTGNILAGTDASLIWNVNLAGNYTVEASTGSNCTPLTLADNVIVRINAPAVYEVTGGGASCESSGATIYLSDSDSQVKYYLKINNVVDLTTELTGNSSALVWDNLHQAGSYQVVAELGNCGYREMNNQSATVSFILDAEAPDVNDTYTFTSGNSVTLNSQAQSGVTYRWYDQAGALVHTGISYTVNNVTTNLHFEVEADNGACTTEKVPVIAGYSSALPPPPIVEVPACGNLYLRVNGSPAAGQKWYWQGTNQAGEDILIDAEKYDFLVQNNDTYYVRTLDETNGVWVPVSTSYLVDDLDQTANTPTDCTDITAMEIKTLPAGYSTGDYNYVRSYDVYAPGIAAGNIASETDNSKVMMNTQYVDGLGRPLQTVSRAAAPGEKDLVQTVTYDEYGRSAIQYLPYVSTESDGSLKTDPFSSLDDFYHGVTGIIAHFPSEEVLYGETRFDHSPLNRALLTMAPGDAWTGSSIGARSDWQVNKATDGVRVWTIGATPSSSSTYGDSELYVTVSTDEAGNQVKEYSNAKGQVILKKVQNGEAAEGHSNWLNTYYLYDTYDNLVFVIPPLAVELAEANNWTLTNANELIFSYGHDGRNRMITKQVPGSGRVDMVYDNLDRLVATQDANQRAIDQWTFTKYDELNRPVMTGFITSTSDRAAMQTDLNNWTGDLFVKDQELTTNNVLEGVSITASQRDTEIATYRAKSTEQITFLPGFVSVANDEFATELVSALSHEYTAYEGYHDATFPLLASSDFQVNTVNFYDNYDFTVKSWDDGFSGKGFYTTTQEEADYNYVPTEQHTNNRGASTGSKVRVLDTDDWLTTVMFYDDRGRVVQTQGENHMGGTDISTSQYDFAGRVLHTYTEHDNPQATADGNTQILKRFEYDHAGRLLTIQEKLNNTGSLKTLVANSYNALGELKTKTLGDNLEDLDYRYNVRGWLKSINGDYVENGTGDSFFGMSFSYDHGFEQNQFNGNIAGVTWRSQSSNKKRAYGFDYDRVNRLTEAGYHQNDGAMNAWSRATADFSTSYGYDANGNILNLMRKGVVAGTIATIDDLTYDYGDGFGLSSNSNQLNSVKDLHGDLGQGDFKDGTNTGDDYNYDLNGNMKDDLNKGITNITYNHLNLPVVVSFGSSKSITYTYDAAGIKLSKLVNDNGSLTTTDYAGGFIYENDALQHFAHEEGRVRLESGTVKYDYFIKDHLGNTRMTLTEARDSVVYDATMETALAGFEESVFLNVAATRSTEEAFEGTASAKLGPESIGPAKMLVVSPGDTVDLSVYVKYPSGFVSTASGSSTNIGLALASLFGATGGGASVYEQGVYNNLNSNAGTFLASAINTGTSTVPKAYLNYVFFDQDFNFIDSKSDYVSVDAGASGAFDILEANDLIMEQAGYLYVYVSNEGRTTDGGNIYFDALRINHKKGHILQEDHYYPFGLTINALSSSAPLSKPNKFKYNGNEEQTEFDLGWMDFNARFYDPQLGRFMQVDPLSESVVQYRQSPYQFGWNNPIRYNDPNGMCPICPALPWIGGAVLEGLAWAGFVGATVYVAAEAGEELADWSSPDPSTLMARTESRPFEGSNMSPSGNNGPDWSRATLALKITTATGLVIQLVKKTGKVWNEEDVYKMIENMSQTEIENLIASVRIAERALASTDLQVFGAVNPSLVEAAASYGILKDIYESDRPWLTDEERNKQQEEANKGRQASQLLQQAGSGELASGIYTWNGSEWVRGENE